ncbi:MAG: amino acid racemase [Bdellovibrionota bacterium]
MGILGILGGLGPLSSTRFLNTIYKESKGRLDQDFPSVVLISDSSFPDRTQLLRNGQYEELLKRTVSSLENLKKLGATKFIVCCFTLHAVFDRLDSDLRGSLISLPEVGLKALKHLGKTSLLLCTSGSREMNIFNNELCWKDVEKLVTFPTEQDQSRIHEIIYELKGGRSPVEAYDELKAMCKNYKTDTWLLGCTEMHLISTLRSQDLGKQDFIEMIDPLSIIAKNLPKYSLCIES